MIQKIFILSIVFLLSQVTLYAKVSHINYKATFGIFGTVGTIKNRLTENEKTYKIETTVKLVGMAKSLLGGQKEEYISKGHMHEGMMVSDYYSMRSIKKQQTKLKEYVINHQKKQVQKRYRKWVKGTLVRDETSYLNFYAKDDLLTLYFNMNKAITQKGMTYTMKAVGLEKQKGMVKVTVPKSNQTASYKKDLGISANWYAKARIVQKNFRKNSGDILLSVENDGFIKKAVIKDILMFGDATLLRIP